MPVHADELLFDFEMEDQFDEIHRRADYTDHPTHCFGGCRLRC